MSSNDKRWYVAAAAAVLVFFVSQAFIFGPLHDLMFLPHTSIQDNVQSCVGTGASLECDSEDGVRAYNSRGWAILGNSVGLLFLALRCLMSYGAFRLVRGKFRRADTPSKA